MKHHLLVLHFGGQCPYIVWVAQQAESAASELDGSIEIVDVTEKPGVAARHRLFFPFMTVLNEATRIPFPAPAARLVEIARSGLHGRPAPRHTPAPAAFPDRVDLLTLENLPDACGICMPHGASCPGKARWAVELLGGQNPVHLGLVAYQRAHPVSAVEVLPSLAVPYPLPKKDPETAFITCIYSLEEGQDFRGALLDPLAGVLSSQGYQRLQVISGREAPYPNGPFSFFQSHGFQLSRVLDRLTVSIEGDEDEILLLEKAL